MQYPTINETSEGETDRSSETYVARDTRNRRVARRLAHAFVTLVDPIDPELLKRSVGVDSRRSQKYSEERLEEHGRIYALPLIH